MDEQSKGKSTLDNLESSPLLEDDDEEKVVVNLLSNNQNATTGGIAKKLDKLEKYLTTKQAPSQELAGPQYFDLLTAKGRSDIKPPLNLMADNNKINLNKLQQLTRIFSSVPVFTNSHTYTIREMLENLNTIANRLESSLSTKEFELILDIKLSPRVKSCIAAYHSESLEALYSNLLNLYSADQTKREAFSQIISGDKKRFTSLRSFTEEILKLLTLSQESEDQKASLFIHALQTILNPRLSEKVLEYVNMHENLNNGKQPSIHKLMDFVFVHRAEIDKDLAKNRDPQRPRFNTYQDSTPFDVRNFEHAPDYNYAPYNEATHFQFRTVENNPDNEPTADRMPPCSKCNRKGHTADRCYANPYCTLCYKNGHYADKCRTTKNKFCNDCHDTSHSTEECTKIKRCRLCNNSWHPAVICPVYAGVEPVRAPCSLCEEKLFLRLYHPKLLCRNFGPRSKN